MSRAALSGTVLLAEDESELLTVYEHWLSERHEVVTATDGNSALEAMDGDVDVAILDRRMPGVTGDAVLEQIRAVGHDCPVAMVTGVDPGLELYELPRDEYLLKPIQRERLVEAVDSLLLRARADTETRELLRLLACKRALNHVRAPETAKREVHSDLLDRIHRLLDRVDVATDVSTAPPVCPGCDRPWDADVDGITGYVPLGPTHATCLRCGKLFEM